MSNRARSPRLVQSTWKEIRDHIERKRDAVNNEIRNYPPPIPACDQQFNHLLEERARIARELARLQAYAEQSSGTGAMRLIDEFISSSAYIDVDVAQKISSSLKARTRVPAGRKRRTATPAAG